MFLHELIIGSLGEEKVIHMLEVKTDGGVRDRKDFLFFLPSCPDAKVLCLVVFHGFLCGPVSRATSENYLTKSSCWESKFRIKSCWQSWLLQPLSCSTLWWRLLVSVTLCWKLWCALDCSGSLHIGCNKCSVDPCSTKPLETATTNADREEPPGKNWRHPHGTKSKHSTSGMQLQVSVSHKHPRTHPQQHAHGNQCHCTQIFWDIQFVVLSNQQISLFLQM